MRKCCRYLEYAILTLVLLLLTSSILADTPLGEPQTYERWSANHKYFVICDPEQIPSTVCIDAESKEVIWSIDQWFGDCEISPDGNYLVGITQNGSLLPLDFETDTVVMSFFDEGKLTKNYTIQDLLDIGLSLERTQSHWSWAINWQMTDMGFLLFANQNEVFIFIPHSGQLYASGELILTDPE